MRTYKGFLKYAISGSLFFEMQYRGIYFLKYEISGSHFFKYEIWDFNSKEVKEIVLNSTTDCVCGRAVV